MFCFFWGGIFDVNALDDKLRRKVYPPSLQEAKELRETELNLDKGIQEWNDKIAYYKKLKDIEVKLTPSTTIFKKNAEKGYIEIESYSFIPESDIHTTLVGVRYKIMRLYYGQGDSANKIETKIFEQNFLTNEKTQSRIIDPSPGTDDLNDVRITNHTNQFNRATEYESQVGQIENSVSRPMRIRFKKRYLKHLVNFEKLLRFTEDFQITYGANADEQVLSSLKKSLKY